MQPIAALFPAAGSLTVWSVRAAVADYTESLFASERAAVAKAVDKRRREFATGRYLARQALSAMALPAVALVQRPDRAPQWPQGVIGSISHSDAQAWVVASRSGPLLGLGADIERLGRLHSDLHDKLFTAAERAQIGSTGAQLATALFCAKEAVYKATQPLAGAFIGFQEVEVQLQADAGQFQMRYLGTHGPSAIMEQGAGYLRYEADHALALFVIPQPALQPASEADT